MLGIGEIRGRGEDRREGVEKRDFGKMWRTW
jgi:hypothetical protein